MMSQMRIGPGVWAEYDPRTKSVILTTDNQNRIIMDAETILVLSGYAAAALLEAHAV